MKEKVGGPWDAPANRKSQYAEGTRNKDKMMQINLNLIFPLETNYISPKFCYSFFQTFLKSVSILHIEQIKCQYFGDLSEGTQALLVLSWQLLLNFKIISNKKKKYFKEETWLLAPRARSLEVTNPFQQLNRQKN